MSKIVWFTRSFVAFHETLPKSEQEGKWFWPGGPSKYTFLTGTGKPDSGNPVFDYDWVEWSIGSVQYTPPPTEELDDEIAYPTDRGTRLIKKWDSISVDDNWKPPIGIGGDPDALPDDSKPDEGFLGAYSISPGGTFTGIDGTVYGRIAVRDFFRTVGNEAINEAIEAAAARLGIKKAAGAFIDAINSASKASKALYKIHDTALSTLTTLSKGTLDPKQMAALIDSTFWEAQRDANETLLDLMNGSTNKTLRDMKSGPAKELAKALTGTTFAVLNPYEYGNNDKDNVFYQSRGDAFHPSDIVGESSSGEGFVVGSIHNDVLHATTYGTDVFAGAGNDTIYEPDSGGDGSYLAGGSGNDTYVVLGFSDPTIYDSSGTDTVIVTGLSFALTNSSKVENLRLQGGDDTWGYGNKLDNQVVGNRGDNHLKGLAGKDTLKGGAGSDTLAGGSKADKLTGSSGADRFVFDTRLGSGNVDTVTDFRHDTDLIALDDAIFRAIGPSLERAEFYARAGATKAHDKSDRIVYDTKTGKLYYDDDGKGGHAAIHFATLSKHPALDYADFVIV